MKKLMLLLFFAGVKLWAQEVTVSGTIIDQIDQTPIAGAVVQIKENQDQTITDIRGHFQFKVLPRKYTLNVMAQGYQSRNEVIIAQRDTFIKIALQPKTEHLEEVIISAVKASPDMPVTQTNVSQKTLQEQNLGQDVPYLIQMTPSVVVTSDAGAGVGYTGVRIRGISSQQINVTLNGIPLNDPESHSVYWVDIPDFAANTQNLQIQRGVGTSTFGTGAFGASLNLATDKVNKEAYGQIQTSYGSFNTQKYSIKGSTGLLNKHFEFTGRFSKITSDGYVDRASSDLKSYYMSGTYIDDKNTLKAMIFGGSEVTYQAWYGVDKATFENNPTFNYAGAIYDDNWNVIDFYDNQVDDYKQDHYQLHFSHKLAENLKLSLAGHYTYGRGYYEQYKQAEEFSGYGFSPVTIDGQLIDKTDLIRRKWLDNDFYGAIASIVYKTDQASYTLGLAANEYDGRHFGRVLWTKEAVNVPYQYEYYNNLGVKKTINGFAKAVYSLSDQLKLFTDIQFRKIDYTVKGTAGYNWDFSVKDDLFFVNPKIGVYYKLNSQNDLYLSLAQTHREPNRDDYENALPNKPEPETLNDVEAGWKYKTNRLQTEVNLYGMYYQNQLVMTGKIDNVGNPIRKNVGESYRVGLEGQVAYLVNDKLDVQANVTISDNRNMDYIAKENGKLVHYGNTRLTYSPDLIFALIAGIKPVKNMNVQLITKYVGDQYMDNRNTAASKLPAYWVENMLLTYKLGSFKNIKSIDLSLKLNNIFDKKYASNGYMWGDDPYYFPQAGINALAGFSITF